MVRRKRIKGEGKIRNARKHSFKEIEFRSALELYCYKQLSKYNIPFSYEPYKITLIPSFEHSMTWIEPNSKKEMVDSKQKMLPMTYTPDFVGDGWIIECKGYQADDVWQKKSKWIKYTLRESNIYFLVPSTQKQVDWCVNYILQVCNARERLL